MDWVPKKNFTKAKYNTKAAPHSCNARRFTSSVLNGAVRPSWGWTVVDGVQRSRPVFSKSCPTPHGQRPFPPPSPAVRQGMK